MAQYGFHNANEMEGNTSFGSYTPAPPIPSNSNPQFLPSSNTQYLGDRVRAGRSGPGAGMGGSPMPQYIQGGMRGMGGVRVTNHAEQPPLWFKHSGFAANVNPVQAARNAGVGVRPTVDLSDPRNAALAGYR